MQALKTRTQYTLSSSVEVAHIHDMIEVHDCETLKDVKPEMETTLAEAAKAFIEAPKRFQAVILEAAASGENANRIAKAIGHAYSPDYVRRLIREAREAGKIPPRSEPTAGD